MTIINATPDSFWAGSRKECGEDIVNSVVEALECGASILDIGGYSTRPNAKAVSEEEERRRVGETLKAIGKYIGDIEGFISIDTFRASVVEEALDIWGEKVIVNDVSAGEDDSRMIDVVAANGLPYIAMHKRGNPETMGSLTHYPNGVVEELLAYFREKLEYLHNRGIRDVIIDLGFGFAKSLEQNFELIRRYNEFASLSVPSLAGVSRKRMVWKTLNTDIAGALNGTSILNYKLLQNGASILRVHDTREAMEVVKLYNIVG